MGALEAIHMSMTPSGVVAAIHFFRGYMEQMIFDSSYLLRPTTFLEDVFCFVSIFIIERIPIIHSLK